MSNFFKPITLILGLLLALWVVLMPVAPDLHAAVEPSTMNLTYEDEELDEATPNLGTSDKAPTSSAILPSVTPEDLPVSATAPIPTTTIVIPTALPTLKPAVVSLLPPERWKEWPVMPTVSEEIRLLYQRSLAQGDIDPDTFSVLGDCQSEAEYFLGVFDSSPALVKTMADDLQEVVTQFAGSFNRYNPAAKSGSSAGSLLFPPWNDNKEGKCVEGETPVDCELRVNRPSIVFIHLGTHFETRERNYTYVSTIIEKVLATGAVPVMVTKADNLELDEFVNQNITDLAGKYGLPLWNFWASVQDLPSHGLQPDGMHLTEEGNVVHQIGALRVLGTVWQAVR